jgi:AmmeMemoRadiSam system protein A
MPADRLTKEERTLLLKAARRALELGVAGEPIGPLNLETYPSKLRDPGATFVTLTIAGQLRGCVGALEPYQPLIEDVCEHAIAAALQDYRFPAVRAEELQEISIEISRLTEPAPLDYQDAKDLINKLRPGIDGVVLKDGLRRATFLPQVWHKIPDPVEFLNHLCVKMGSPSDLWRRKKLDVLVYQVEEFHE